MRMGRLFVLMFVMGMFLSFGAQMQTVKAGEGVTVGFGSLKLGGIFQATGMFTDADNDSSEFKLKRARLLLSGTLIPDKVKFFVQCEGVSSPYVLDSKMILSVIPKTAIVIGRFIPNFTLYMPYHTGKMELINYPLVTTKHAMWRQSGIQSQTKTPFVDIYLGVFNGYQYNETSGALSGNDWGDDNDAKDFLVRADVKPIDGLKIGLYGWFGSPYDADLDDDFTANRFGVNFKYTISNFHVTGEYLLGNTDYDCCDVDSMGYFLQFGAKFAESFEVVGRYDYFDNNEDIDDMDETWMTVGLNYEWAKYNVKFYLDVINKDSEMYVDSIGDDKELQVVLMAQYCF